jgi:hypothetical protein
MSKLTLIIFLGSDPKESLQQRIGYVERENKISLLERDGVILLSNNAALFDNAKAHDAYAILSSNLVLAKKPFLSVQMDASESVLVGSLPKEIEEALGKYNFPQILTD